MMPFPFHIDIVNLVFKGIMIGIIASAPMGPVGVLCVQRTLNKGRWYGFVTGIGASVSDIIYALITGLGMSFVMDFVNNAQTKFLLQLTGSIILLIFGIISYRANPTKNMHMSSKQKGTLWHNGLTAFLVTFSNPLIIFTLHGMFCAICIRGAQPSAGNVSGLHEHCLRSPVVVVRTDMAHRQGAHHLRHEWHHYYK